MSDNAQIRKRSLLLGILLVCGLVLFAYEARRPHNPVYQGKPLLFWLEQTLARGVSDEDTNAVAIRHFGTNALPALLEMAQALDWPLKRSWIALMRSQSIVPNHLHTDQESRNMASYGFYALGPLAKDAVPDLIKLMASPYRDVRLAAGDCLGNIGPEAQAAVPFMIPFLNDPDKNVRLMTTIHLWQIHMLPELVVPALISSLTSTNSPPGYDAQLSIKTMMALQSFGENARSAIPILQQYLIVENSEVRKAATNALRVINARLKQ
jgi:HEAT repeat protein